MLAFTGSIVWSFGVLLTFLRLTQGCLMWRQTGPVLISITYITADVGAFLFIFVIVYVSFTLVIVFLYEIYENDVSGCFNSHEKAFKLLFWSMIRTGGLEFPNILTKAVFNTTCLRDVLSIANQVAKQDVIHCKISDEDEMDSSWPSVTGNTLWAVYQFLVSVVMLSLLGARMITTYQEIHSQVDLLI